MCSLVWKHCWILMCGWVTGLGLGMTRVSVSTTCSLTWQKINDLRYDLALEVKDLQGFFYCGCRYFSVRRECFQLEKKLRNKCGICFLLDHIYFTQYQYSDYKFNTLSSLLYIASKATVSWRGKSDLTVSCFSKKNYLPLAWDFDPSTSNHFRGNSFSECFSRTCIV